MPSIGFQTFFLQAFKIVVDSQYVIAIYDDGPIFMILGAKEHQEKELEYTLLKPDCHSWLISKMQSERQDTLEERYAIKFCFWTCKKCHRNV